VRLLTFSENVTVQLFRENVTMEKQVTLNKEEQKKLMVISKVERKEIGAPQAAVDSNYCRWNRRLRLRGLFLSGRLVYQLPAYAG
jgi:hypothetical protein